MKPTEYLSNVSSPFHCYGYSLGPKWYSLTLPHFSKSFLSLQGIFKCYHLYEVFPDRCANPQLKVFFPLPPNLPLQMPVISPMNASCLCLLWLWALWEWKSHGGSLVEKMCPLHQNPLNKFLLEISARNKSAPTDTFVYILLSDSGSLLWFFPFYLSYQEA